MAKNTATILGLFLVAVGLIGFAVPGFMGMNLTVAHNFLHLASGAAALYFGRKNTPAVARTFCIVFGTLYGLLGLAGLLAGGPDNTLTLIPGELVLGKVDHVVHLFLGAVFLATGLFRRMVTAMPPKH